MGRNKKEIDDVFEKIDDYVKSNDLNKSELVEKLWKEFIESKDE